MNEDNIASGSTESIEFIPTYDFDNELRKKVLDVHRSDEWKQTKRNREQTENEKKNHFKPGNNARKDALAKKGMTEHGLKRKHTVMLKETIALIVAKQIPKVNRILDKLSKEDPGRFIDQILKFSEFVTPKISRTEMTGEVQHNNILVVGKPADLNLPEPNQNTIDLPNEDQ